MATAHSNAFTAEPNEAMNPSPIVLTSEPPWAFSASRTMRSCSRSTSRAFASPRRWVIAVEAGTPAFQHGEPRLRYRGREAAGDVHVGPPQLAALQHQGGRLHLRQQ